MVASSILLIEEKQIASVDRLNSTIVSNMSSVQSWLKFHRTYAFGSSDMTHNVGTPDPRPRKSSSEFPGKRLVCDRERVPFRLSVPWLQEIPNCFYEYLLQEIFLHIHLTSSSKDRILSAESHHDVALEGSCFRKKVTSLKRKT